MKKIKIFSLFILLTTLTLTTLAGCVNKNTTEKLTVYTTIYPLYDFTKKVGGDKINVVNLVPAGSSSHEFNPSAKIMIDLENSDLIIANGVGFESWIPKTSSNVRQKVVYASDGIMLIENQHSNTDDDNSHSHNNDHDHDNLQYNPHVWLNINNAKLQMQNIKNALALKDPINKDYYENNYNKYAVLFDSLHNYYKQELKDLTNNTIIVSHGAYDYMAKEYGLNQLSIEGLNPDNEVSAKTIADIISYINKNNITTIFSEEFSSTKITNKIKEETGVLVKVLSPLETISQSDELSGNDYLSKMSENLLNLLSALKTQ